MTAGSFELTPWERRREWYSNIELGRDVKKQTELLKKQARVMFESQAASVSQIVASQDGIRDMLSGVSYSIEDISEGMYGLKAAFEFGISEVVWQIEQNRRLLRDILEALMAPLDTQAKELRRRAEDAYANAWYDDALEDFLESEKKNKYDFTVHISIGLLYLFHYPDREKAYQYFQNAIKYAKPKSAYHASFALLHAALIKRDSNELSEAEKLTAEAVALTPLFAEALYQNAQYNAQLRNVAKSIAALEQAIKLDKNYSIKADTDEMFTPIINDVSGLFERLRDNIKEKCVSSCDYMESILEETDQLVSNNQTVFDKFSISTTALSEQLSDIRRLISRNSYFDCLNAQTLLKAYVDTFKEFIQNLTKHSADFFNKQVTTLEGSLRHVTQSDETKIEKRRDSLSNNTPLGCLIWGILLFGNLYLFIQTPREKFYSHDPIVIVYVILDAVFLFGGWFIANGVLSLLAAVLFHKRDFSQLITDNQKAIYDLESHRDTIGSELSKIKDRVVSIARMPS